MTKSYENAKRISGITGAKKDNKLAGRSSEKALKTLNLNAPFAFKEALKENPTSKKTKTLYDQKAELFDKSRAPHL